jgi:hypothetical protein
MLRTTVAKLLSAKLVAAAAVATAATGGVALAAATNTLPDQAQSVAHDILNAPSPDHGKPSQAPSQAATPDAKSSHAPKGTPSPSLRGLCTAYQAGVADSHGKAMSNPAFSALVTAAGGTDQVADYCTKLIGAPRTHPSGEPTSHPTGSPTSHPSGKPTAVPTDSRPTSVPSGPPSTHPSKR